MEQLLCIFSVPNNRRKFACRKNRFNILHPLYEKGKTIRKTLHFQSGTGIFQLLLLATCWKVSWIGLCVPLSIYEFRRAQRRHIIAVKAQDKIPLVERRSFPPASELSIAKGLWTNFISSATWFPNKGSSLNVTGFRAPFPAWLKLSKRKRARPFYLAIYSF